MRAYAHERAGAGVAESGHAPVRGDYRCCDCGYGVSVMRELPACPMCGGERWEPAARMRVRRLHLSATDVNPVTPPIVSAPHLRR